jgi:putative thioredoxin
MLWNKVTNRGYSIPSPVDFSWMFSVFCLSYHHDPAGQEGTMASWIFDVAEANFQREVLERSREVPVVVDFWAEWCPPCRMLGPLLENLVQERKGEVLLAKVNIDEAQNVAAQFGINSIPTVIGFKDGRAVVDFMGFLPEHQLREFLDRLVPSEADRLAKQARAQEQANPAEAETLYRQALKADYRHETALLGLVRLLIAQGKDAEAKDYLENAAFGEELAEEADRLKAILEVRSLARPFGSEADARRRLEADPKNPLALYELGCVVATAGDYNRALDLLLKAGERDQRLASAQVREAMVKIFLIVGVRSPLADEYRDKLTALLY